MPKKSMPLDSYDGEDHESVFGFYRSRSIIFSAGTLPYQIVCADDESEVYFGKSLQKVGQTIVEQLAKKRKEI
jgi:hypothetical protein